MEEVKVGRPTRWTDRTQPRLVLIEGAPGVGKTTFSEQFCYKWSQGQQLANHKLLVLLPLRDKGVRSAKNVSDLFHHPQLQQAIAEEVEGSGGKGVALWLEAWDELEEDMRERSALFLKLVYGQVLPKATTIITSRPWATEKIQESGKVDQHIEIVSTPSIQFSRVLREDRVKADSRAKFLDYINLNPAMKAAMHTPVTANIVADIFQWSRDMESPPPTTLTQLYTALICKLLMEHLSSLKAEGKPPKIRSLEEVPEDVKKQFLNLCRLSWEGLLRQQLTFSSSAVGRDTLGLMHSVRELYGGKDSQLSYHFMHLTLQEFLSAYHISQLPPDTQQQVIKGHIDTGHLTMAVRFFFGLTKSNPFTTSLISDHITSQWRRSRSRSVFHWVYEGGAVGELAKSGKTITVRSSYAWSPLDYYVFGHSIPLFNVKWNLGFDRTSMGDEEVKTFVQGLSTCKDIYCEEITKVNFSTNNITLDGVKWLVNIPLPILQLIKVLDLGDNKLDQDAATAFSQIFPNLTALQVLSLSGNPLGAAGAVEVLRALHHCKSPLKTLWLQHTGVGEEDIVPPNQPIVNNNLETLSISGDLLPSIIKCPLSNTTLKTFHLHTTLSDEAAICLRSLLQQSVLQFRELVIGDCHVTSEGAVQLARGLIENQYLTVLNMRYNSIGDTGAAALGDMLKYNTSLQEIDIGGCSILSQGAVQIAAGLTENSTLRVLYMDQNELGVVGAEAIGRMLVQNNTLQELNLSEDDTLGDGVSTLLSSLHKNKTLCLLKLSWKYWRQHPSDSRVQWW